MSRHRTPLEAKRATLSVLMPVFNERDTIDSIVDAVLTAPVAPIRLELVAVDDCSTDGSRDVLQRLHEQGKIHKLHLQPKNRGKGAAITRVSLAPGSELSMVWLHTEISAWLWTTQSRRV